MEGEWIKPEIMLKDVSLEDGTIQRPYGILVRLQCALELGLELGQFVGGFDPEKQTVIGGCVQDYDHHFPRRYGGRSYSEVTLDITSVGGHS